MTTPNDPTIPDDSLDGIIAAFLQSIDAGENPDRQALLDRYPQHAGALRAFFADHDRMDQAAEPLRLARASDSPVKEDATKPLPRVRYFGDYELLAEIARGGMGIVYKARQVSLNRIVALKMILAGQFASEAEVKRFYEEAKSAANLRHPNIVAIHEVGQHENQHYFSMDYIEGRSLSQIVRESPLPADKAARYLKTIADAIQFAHEQGTLHRDLKPSNVLIDRFDEPQVTDFGLAKRIEGTAQLSATGSLAGTPSYMPPEQAGANGGKLSPASDVYSLGAVLYELLTGRPPFLAETLIVTLNQVLNNEPVSPRLLNPKVPRDLETICLKCLEKSPAKRYSSAAELADDLDRFLAGKPIHARPVSSAERAWRWCRRSPVTASLAAVIVVLLLVSAIGGSVLAIRERDARQAADQNAALESEAAHRAELAGAEAERRRIEAESQRERADAATHQAEYRLYASEIAAASLEWHAGNPMLAWAHLDLCPVSFRGWEYRYLHSLFNRNQRTLVGHTGYVGQAIFSPNGKRIASASDDGSVKIWDTASGHNLLTLDASPGLVRSVAFSRDGRRIVSGSGDGAIKVWDALSGRNELTMIVQEKNSSLAKVAFSCDGKQLFATDEKALWAWDALDGHAMAPPNGAEHHELDSLKAYLLGFRSRDLTPERPSAGPFVAQFRAEGLVTLKCTVSVWAIFPATFPAENKCPFPMPAGISPDHKWLATLDNRGNLIVCNATTGQVVQTLGGADEPLCISFSPDSQRIAMGSAKASVKIWDVETAKVLQVLNGHKAEVLSVAFSPDGKQLLSASRDRSIKLWNLAGGPNTIEAPTASHHYAFHLRPASDGRTIRATNFRGSDAPVPTLIIGATPRHRIEIIETSPFMQDAALSPDGNTFIGCRANTVSFWNTACTTPAFQWKSEKDCLINAISASFSRHLVAWIENELNPGDGTIISVWDLAKRKQIAQLDCHVPPDAARERSLTRPNEQRLWGCLALSHDGRRIAASDPVGRLHLWTLPSGKDKVILDSHGSSIGPAAFRPDGRQIAVADGIHGTLTFVSMAGPALTSIVVDHVGPVNDLAFSPDGTRLASAGDDKTVRIWNTQTGDQMLPLRGHTAAVDGVSFGPGGKYIVSTSDHEIIFWDASDQSPEVTSSLNQIASHISAWNHVDRLFSALLLKSDVLDRLKADATFSKEFRDCAIDIASRRAEDAAALNEASWKIVSHPDSRPEEYNRALRWAEAACRPASKDIHFDCLNTLGVARFRVGQHANAIDVLTQTQEHNSRSKNGPQPADVAFLAMAHHALGHVRKAQALMSQLTALLKQDRWKNNAEAATFLTEARQRLSQKP